MAPEPGDEVRSGLVFRRIPPLASRFRKGQIKLSVFKPDPADDAGKLSMTWEELAPADKVLEVAVGIAHPKGVFGLCAVSIDAIREARDPVRFLYELDPTDWLLGAAHVVVPGCYANAQAVLLRHATIIRAPVGPEIQ